MRFLSLQADDNEDLESNDILGNGKIKVEQNAVNNDKVPKRLEVAVDIVDGKNGGQALSKSLRALERILVISIPTTLSFKRDIVGKIWFNR